MDDYGAKLFGDFFNHDPPDSLDQAADAGPCEVKVPSLLWETIAEEYEHFLVAPLSYLDLSRIPHQTVHRLVPFGSSPVNV